MIELNNRDKEQVLATLTSLENIDEAVALFAQAVYEDAVDKADEHTKSGAMVRSLYLHRIDDGFEMGADASIAPYAVFVHWGTRAHEIKAKNKQALRFVWHDETVWFWGEKTPQEKAKIMAWKKKQHIHDRFFFKWPHHPGYKGDPFFYDAIEESLPKLNRYFERFIDDL